MPPFQLDNATANLNLNDPDYLPPPPPELLQQQYLYGTVPDSRQQAVITNYAPTRGQGFPTYAPGTGQMDMGQPQQVSSGISSRIRFCYPVTSPALFLYRHQTLPLFGVNLTIFYLNFTIKKINIKINLKKALERKVTRVSLAANYNDGMAEFANGLQ